MEKKKDRDGFEIYNDGVDRILEEFGPCRHFLDELKKQEKATENLIEELKERYKKRLADIDSMISRQNDINDQLDVDYQNTLSEEENNTQKKKDDLEIQRKEQTKNNEEAISLYEKNLSVLEKEIREKEIGIENPLTPETVTERVGEFRRDKEEFQRAENWYVQKNRNQERLAEKAKRSEILKNRQGNIDNEVEKAALERFQGEGRRLEHDEDADMLPETPNDTLQEIKRISDERERLVEEDVEALLDVRRKQDENRIALARETHKKNQNRKEQMKTLGRWTLCFPIRILGKSQSVNKKVLDYAGFGTAFICSLVMLLNPGFLKAIIAVTVVSGVIAGLLRRKREEKMAVGIVRGIGSLAIRILPYPILLFIITRNLYIWLAWLLLGILLYTGYDLYYLIRSFRPSYKKLYQQYTQERNKYYDERRLRLEERLEKYAVIQGEETARVKMELEEEERQLNALINSIQEEEGNLKAVFEEEIWDKVVGSFRKKLEQKLEEEQNQEEQRLSRLAELREEYGNQKKQLKDRELKRDRIKKEFDQKIHSLDKDLEKAKDTAEKELKDQKKNIEKEVCQLEEKKTQIQKKQKEEEARKRSEREKEHEILKQEYQAELGRLMNQMETDGFKEVCGFDYREAWAVMHGMTENLIGLPANMSVFFDNKVQANVLQKLTAKEQEISEKKLMAMETKGCYMPWNIPWGVEPCGEEEIDEEIRSELEKVLGAREEFKLKEWDDPETYGIRTPGTDTLYRLKMIDSEGGPVLLYYDLGDMADRERCMDLLRYVMKNFVYRPYFYSGENPDYFGCDVLVSDYAEYFKDFQEIYPLNDALYMDVTKKDGFRKTIEKLYEKGEKTRGGLKTFANLYEKNRQCCKRDDPPAKSDGYRNLILVNIDYKELERTDLEGLMKLVYKKEKGNLGGVYPYLLVDLNRLNNGKDGPDMASVKYCMKLVNGFEGKICQLKKVGRNYCLYEKTGEDLMRILKDI